MNLKSLASNASEATTLASLAAFTALLLSLAFVRIDCCDVELCSHEYAEFIDARRQCHQLLISNNGGGNSRREKADHNNNNANSQKEYCAVLEAINQCMKALSKPCRGHLQYHTFVTLLRQWIANGCGGKNGEPPKSNLTLCETFVKPTANSNHNNNGTHREEQRQRKIKQCLQNAYNYSIDVETFAYLKETSATNNNHKHNLPIVDSLPQTQPKRKAHQRHNRKRHRRNKSFESDNDEYYEEDDESESEEISSRKNLLHNVDEIDDTSDVEMSKTYESLTCIIYGDPHLRTFAQSYQTCRCQGAWPLIEHPLFAVQITNSKLKKVSEDAFGITRVTILVRQFESCEIRSNLIYEAETSQKQSVSIVSLPNTFTDGSRTTSNNVVRIVSSSKNVVTIHLDHIGVEIHVAHFDTLNYLNIVVKLKDSFSTEKQAHFFDALSELSLCKRGCPIREQIDVNAMIEAKQISISSPALTKNKNDSLCKGLFGYYRNACIYDSFVKAIAASDKACKFGQSFDYLRIINKMYVEESVERRKNSTKSSATSSNKQFMFFLVIVFLNVHSFL